MRIHLWPGALALSTLVSAANGCARPPTPAVEGEADAAAGALVCTTAGPGRCEGDVAVRCVSEGAFLRAERTDCELTGERCAAGACVPCIAGSSGCFEGNAARCRDDGSGWEVTATCDLEAGQACISGACANLCELAVMDRSYEGCEFYPVDLDTRGFSAPPFGIIVSNPNPFATHVVLEVDDSAPGQAPSIRTVAEVDLPPLDLESFVLDRRRIDGVPDGTGWRETGTARTRRAYRVRARHPVIAYQFNPLAQADVFSNDASLLFPTSALGTRTTVIGWPQNLSTRGTLDEVADEDYRSTLTLVGTAAGTSITVRFGPQASRILGLEPGEVWGPGDEARFELGPFDTLNLETDGFLADFTGTVVESSQGVVVYTGSEGADVPSYERTSQRLCCADHIEGQLPPDRSLGTRFVLARTPSRSRAINEALTDAFFALPEAEEYEVARVLAVEPGTTRVDTALAAPYDAFLLAQGQSATLVLDRDTELVASQSVAVIQLLAGQEALGIPGQYPGGDPALIVVPPVDQFRRDYVFLTPATYGFDAVTIVSPPAATVLLDDAPLPATCERVGSDGSSGAMAPWVIHRCPLSFPIVNGDFSVSAGSQGDGVHRVRADVPVGVVVSGFDAFVSYAYAAGMDLELLR
jgi:hypothetical protein